jgi:hypothetical protein
MTVEYLCAHFLTPISRLLTGWTEPI